MSTIASPRDSIHAPRPLPITPTSSARPSLDINTTRSLAGSPNPNHNRSHNPSTSSTPTPVVVAGPKQRANRAALREYYNLKRSNTAGTATPPLVEVTDPLGVGFGISISTGGAASEIPLGELDAPGFDVHAFAQRTLAECGLEELLKVYARVLGEMRALDAEKKALVYDNYSKLISATDTIRKMRANMDPLNPMASTLDPAIGDIYSQASLLRDSLRENAPQPETSAQEARRSRERQDHTKHIARIVLNTPDKLRALVAGGRLGDARKEWAMPRRLLKKWREQGLGGDDVQQVIDEGDAVVAGPEAGPETGVAAEGAGG